MNNTPLTAEQSRFAEENHHLVGRYLHSRGLSYDEFYDVVIFGYLNAVRKYTTREDLRQYQFSTIAWWAMKTSVSNYRLAQNLPRRRAVVLDLYEKCHPGSALTLAETVPGGADTEGAALGSMAAERLISAFDRQERTVLSLLAGGADERQIAKDTGEDKETVLTRIEGIRAKARELTAA